MPGAFNVGGRVMMRIAWATASLGLNREEDFFPRKKGCVLLSISTSPGTAATSLRPRSADGDVLTLSLSPAENFSNAQQQRNL